MDYDERIVSLKIKSYVGASIGAIHTYGTMQCRNQVGHTRTIEVERPMTQAEATKENAKDARYGETELMNRAGQITSRLRDEEDVIQTATSMWRQNFPHAYILILRDLYSSSKPGRILDGPDEATNLRLNLLWADYEEAVDCQWSLGEIQEIAEQWQDEFKVYVSTLPPAEGIKLDEEYNPEAVAELMRQNKLAKAAREAEEVKRDKERREAARREFEHWQATAEFKEITLTVKAHTTMAKTPNGGERGYLTFYVGCSDVTNDDGEKIGCVLGDLGGGVWLGSWEPGKSEGHDLYQVEVPELWRAFIEALSKVQQLDGRTT